MNVLWQSVTEIAPPRPKLTEKDLPDLSGKIYLVTGATSGVGIELAKILYLKNATVYIGTRSEANFEKAVNCITTHSAGPSKGELRLLKMDLMDLRTVKAAAEKLIAEVPRLDSVWYNAGIMGHPTLDTTVQGYEVHWGTNVVGHFLLNELLTALLISSAVTAKEKASVRAIWVASDANLFSPADGINWDDVNFTKKGAVQLTKYGQSKAAAIILGHEFAKRMSENEIVSLSLNPGHLITGMQENRPKWLQQLGNLFSYDAKYGAYTEIFAGFTPLNVETQNGSYIVPWGRFGTPRNDIKEGYTIRGTGARLWEMLEAEVKPYLGTLEV
ncbi:uncharacterized protein V1513DRAFT_455173 [Lipomyces chichibuensis]|uniref:uncharacterized protein n=1 Tax=Lipomyces chichibuensis TaxID=1546026 RepID=UPI0033432056